MNKQEHIFQDNFLIRKCKIRNGIYDFIKSEEDFVQNYERIALDRKYNISTETKILSNCFELIYQCYKRLENRVLDIGCSNGYMLKRICADSKVGVDVSYVGLRGIKDKDIYKIRTFGEDIPIADEAFDFIICTDVIEHVIEAHLIISEIHRLLKKGGILFFASPWKQDLSVYDSIEYKKNYKQYKYVHLRTIDEIFIETEFNNGFNIISETLITAHEKEMTIRPYSIKVIVFRKKDSNEDSI